jgi:hypothetical protein
LRPVLQGQRLANSIHRHAIMQRIFSGFCQTKILTRSTVLCVNFEGLPPRSVA